MTTKTLTPAQQLSLAIKTAAEGHYDQFDKGGRPYILHVLKVMHYLKSEDDELNCIAVLHDTIEDCDVTFEQLDKLGFSERVIDGVKRLTKQRGQSSDEYLKSILSNQDACLVKICDLRHNSDIRRLKGVREKDFTRMQKYHTMHLQIQSMLTWYEGHRADWYTFFGDWLDHQEQKVEEILSGNFSN